MSTRKFGVGRGFLVEQPRTGHFGLQYIVQAVLSKDGCQDWTDRPSGQLYDKYLAPADPEASLGTLTQWWADNKEEIPRIPSFIAACEILL